MTFQGVCTALITPFINDRIDYESLHRLIDFQVESGVDAIVITGTTGEAPTIDDEEKAELFRIAGEMIDGRVTFIAGTGTNNTRHVIRLCEYAQDAGADGFLINNPYYNKSSDEGILRSYESIAASVDRDIILYNVPSRTGKNMSAELSLELLKNNRIAGIKEASGDISQIAKICAKLPEGKRLYSGNDDQILPILSLGGSGVISVLSNLAPRMVKNITDSFFAGDIMSARNSANYALDLANAMFIDNNPITIKEAMSLMGMCSNELRLPLVNMNSLNREKLIGVMRNYGYAV
ncbi:MAG: 4-hydroxy-tetrahydrodipicolinate synthase [Anaerofustis stercorihominis]|nr:4-hydroxy-tetrahydrodipicolinate synthase [Anaerofustis stercorihominis]